MSLALAAKLQGEGRPRNRKTKRKSIAGSAGAASQQSQGPGLAADSEQSERELFPNEKDKLWHEIERGNVDYVRRNLQPSQVNTIYHVDYAMKKRTPLYWAAHFGQLGVAEYLINIGANVDGCFKEEDDRPPLFTAAKHGRIEMVRMLLRHGADVNYVEAGSGPDVGWTPLHVAVNYFQETIAAELIMQHARVDAMNKQRQTPLDLIRQSKAEPLKRLLEEADPVKMLQASLRGAVSERDAKQARVPGDGSVDIAALTALSAEVDRLRTQVAALPQGATEGERDQIERTEEAVLELVVRLNTQAESLTGIAKEVVEQNKRLIVVEQMANRLKHYEPMLAAKEQELQRALEEDNLLKQHPKALKYAKTYAAVLNGTYTAAMVVMSGLVALETDGMPKRNAKKADKVNNAAGLVDAANTGAQFVATVLPIIKNGTDAMANAATMIPMVGGAVSLGLTLIKAFCENRIKKDAFEQLDRLMDFAGPDPTEWYKLVKDVSIAAATDPTKYSKIDALKDEEGKGIKAKITAAFRACVNWFSTDPKRDIVERQAMEDAGQVLEEAMGGIYKGLPEAERKDKMLALLQVDGSGQQIMPLTALSLPAPGSATSSIGAGGTTQADLDQLRVQVLALQAGRDQQQAKNAMEAQLKQIQQEREAEQRAHSAQLEQLQQAHANQLSTLRDTSARDKVELEAQYAAEQGKQAEALQQMQGAHAAAQQAQAQLEAAKAEYERKTLEMDQKMNDMHKQFTTWIQDATGWMGRRKAAAIVALEAMRESSSSPPPSATGLLGASGEATGRSPSGTALEAGSV